MFKMLDDKPTVNQFGEIEGAYQFGRSDVKTTEQLKVGDVLSGHGYPKITKKEHIRTTKGGKKIYKLGYQHTRKEQGYNEGHSFDRESNEGQGHFLLNSSQHSVHQFGEDHGALESHGYKLRKNSQTRFSHDKLNAHVDFAKDGSWHHYSENAGTKYTNKKGKGTQELNNHLTEHHKIGSQHSEQFKESISDILQSFGYKRGDTGGWANGEHSVHTIAGGQGAFKHTHKGKSTTGVDKEDLISHLRKVHSSQHSELSQPLTFAPTARGIIGPPVQFREEAVEQFGESGTPFKAGKYHPSGTKVKFHDGEHKGHVVSLDSVIPKRYNKEETTYRGKIVGGKFNSESARNITATENHMAKFAHYHNED